MDDSDESDSDDETVDCVGDGQTLPIPSSIEQSTVQNSDALADEKPQEIPQLPLEQTAETGELVPVQQLRDAEVLWRAETDELRQVVHQLEKKHRAELEQLTRLSEQKLTLERLEKQQLSIEKSLLEQKVEDLQQQLDTPALQEQLSPVNVTYGQLTLATQGFCDLIGSAGLCSSVFRGEWRGKSVAVKRINQAAHSGGFRRELKALSACRHVNVLRVLAHNEDGDPDGAHYLVPSRVGCGCILRMSLHK